MNDQAALERALVSALEKRLPSHTANAAPEIAIGTALLAKKLDRLIELEERQNQLLERIASQPGALEKPPVSQHAYPMKTPAEVDLHPVQYFFMVQRSRR